MLPNTRALITVKITLFSEPEKLRSNLKSVYLINPDLYLAFNTVERKTQLFLPTNAVRSFCDAMNEMLRSLIEFEICLLILQLSCPKVYFKATLVGTFDVPCHFMMVAEDSIR